MCGIVGVATRSARDLRGIPERMTATIVHRGPDDDGFYYDRGVGLGMRRLSIIDLSGGHQPLSSENDQHWIVFNGEIYNHEVLHAELSKAGHQFRTRSDTEAIIHAFESDGANCVHRFNGMFGFAIWDVRRRRLFLARDRLGVKPLYYAWDGETLVFASEIKAILASGLVKRTLDQHALWHYLTFGYVPTPLTMWEGIRKLPPAHHLTLDVDTGEPQVQRYWDIPYDGPREELTDDQELAEFTERFLDSVRLRLIADVPVGIFLSGGLDSSAVAAAVNEVHNTRLNTFSIAFRDGGRYDETPYARQVAQALGTHHHEVHIGRDEYLGAIPAFIHHSDEPLSDQATISLMLVSRLAAQHVKVVLSGEGADEVLAGYDLERMMTHWQRRERLLRWPRALRSTVPSVMFRLARRPDLVRRLTAANLPLSEQLIATIPYMTRFFSSEEKRALWPGSSDTCDSDELVRGYYRRAPTREPLQQLLYAYCQDWLVEDLLMKADKMTMASSIELRVPFLDYRLVEWLATRPPAAKIRKDSNGVWRTKYLLRQFCASRVPQSVIERSKEGFPSPVRQWIQQDLGASIERDLLASDSFVGSLFDRGRLTSIAANREASALDANRLWLLYVLNTWAKHWL